MVLFDAFVDFVIWYLQFPLFHWELFLVVSEYAQRSIQLVLVC